MTISKSLPKTSRKRLENSRKVKETVQKHSGCLSQFLITPNFKIFFETKNQESHYFRTFSRKSFFSESDAFHHGTC